jgi:hypothetical protein
VSSKLDCHASHHASIMWWPESTVCLQQCTCCTAHYARRGAAGRPAGGGGVCVLPQGASGGPHKGGPAPLARDPLFLEEGFWKKAQLSDVMVLLVVGRFVPVIVCFGGPRPGMCGRGVLCWCVWSSLVGAHMCAILSGRLCDTPFSPSGQSLSERQCHTVAASINRCRVLSVGASLLACPGDDFYTVC